MKLVIVMGLLFSVSAFAGDVPGKSLADAAFDRLVKATDMGNVMDQTIDLMVTSSIQRQPGMKPIEPDLRKFFQDNISFKAIEKDVKKIYQDEFTPTEIDDIAKFYETPTGKKAMQKMPMMMMKSQQLSQGIIQAKMPAFLESVKDKLPKQGGK